MKSRKLTIALAGAVTALALVLAGCGSAAPTADPTDEASPVNLRVSVPSQPASLDFTKSDLSEAGRIWTSIYDTLIYRGPDGEFQPQAAESWEYNDDGTVLTLQLREGMTFSNGDPVDAAAVKATMDRQIAAGSESRSAAQFAYISDVTADGDLTVVITLSEPDPSLLYSLSEVAGIIGNPKTFDGPDQGTNPVGSGPYILDVDKTTPGAVYVVNKNENYWNVENTPFETVEFKVIEDTTAALNALLSGQLDVTNITTAQVKQIEDAGMTAEVIEAAYGGGLIIADRGGKVIPALGDPRVRQAINMVFDREAMVEKLQDGIGLPTRQVFQPGTDGYLEGLEDVYDFDVEAAKGLMADAGYEEGFEVTMPSVGRTGIYEPTIAASLAEINITANFVAVPFSQVVGELPTEKYPMYFFPLGYSSMPANIQNWLTTDSLFNGFKSSDPQLDAYMAEARSADPATQTAAYEKIAQFLSDEAWFAPILTLPQVFGAAPGYIYETGPNGAPNIRSFSYSAP